MGRVDTFQLLLESVRTLVCVLMEFCFACYLFFIVHQGADLSIYGVHGSVLEVCSQSPFQDQIAKTIAQIRGPAQMQSLTLQVSRLFSSSFLFFFSSPEFML